MNLIRFKKDCVKVNSCCVVAPAGWTGVGRIKGKEKTSRIAG